MVALALAAFMRCSTLEAEYVFMYPNQHSRGHVFSRIHPYSAVFTVFLSVVSTRSSEYAAQYRLLALRLAYSARRHDAAHDRSAHQPRRHRGAAASRRRRRLNMN